MHMFIIRPSKKLLSLIKSFDKYRKMQTCYAYLVYL